jgi:hypothetical protein
MKAKDSFRIGFRRKQKAEVLLTVNIRMGVSNVIVEF